MDKQLAVSGLFALRQEGSRLHLVLVNTPARAVAEFGFALATCVMGINAAAQFIRWLQGAEPSPLPAFLLSLLASVFGLLWWRVRRARKRSESLPTDELHTLVTLDLETDVLFDGAGVARARVSEARFEVRRPFFSMSAHFFVRWPSGEIDLGWCSSRHFAIEGIRYHLRRFGVNVSWP